MDPLRQAYEEELELDRLAKIERRFKPDVLDHLATMESTFERLESSLENVEANSSRVVELLEGVNVRQPVSPTPVTINIPKWMLCVIIVLLGIIAFK